MAGDKVRGAKVSPIYRFQGRKISVGTTAERLAEVQAEKHFILLIADRANTDRIFVGNEENQFIPLDAGGFLGLYSDLYDIYVKANSGTQTLYMIAQKDKDIFYMLSSLPILYRGADGRSNSNPRKFVEAFNMLFNETGWDRQRGNVELTIMASATRSASTSSADIINYNHRGIILFLDITARTVGLSPLIRLKVEMKDPLSGSYNAVVYSSTFDPETKLFAFLIYPGIKDDESLTYRKSYDSLLSRVFRVRIAFVQDVTDLTYSLSGVLLV